MIVAPEFELVAVRVKKGSSAMRKACPCGAQLEPLEQLRQALDTYEQVRIGGAIVEASDPQACQLNPSRCEKCKHGGRCDKIPADDCFEPRTLRTGEALYG